MVTKIFLNPFLSVKKQIQRNHVKKYCHSRRFFDSYKQTKVPAMRWCANFTLILKEIYVIFINYNLFQYTLGSHDFFKKILAYTCFWHSIFDCSLILEYVPKQTDIDFNFAELLSTYLGPRPTKSCWFHFLPN